jgi:hypothetical protein
VLGQSAFDRFQSNDDDQDGLSGAASARTLSYPYFLAASPAGQLFVADLFNNRVLGWNSIPTSDFAPADIVLGQSDFTRYHCNDADQDGVSDGPSAQTLCYPAGLHVIDDRLVVTDNQNYRYLIYQSK